MYCGALGLGFTKLRTAVVIVIMKLCIGLKIVTSQLIRHNIEAILLKIGILKFPF